MARTSRPGRGDDVLVRELVSSPQRQQIVTRLADHDGDATFEELVDVLSDGPEETMTAVRLHHVHLPKLQAVGAVDWDREAGTVRLTPRARRALETIGPDGLFGRVAGD
jgi:hypothetical protein